MRVSELAAVSGVSVPTIKFYLREGLLPAGELTSATQATYGGPHVARLRLVRALTDVAGLSLAATRSLLAVVDGATVHGAMGRAQALLPPTVAEDVDTTAARDAVARLGWSVEAGSVPLRQLAVALQAVQDAGLPLTDERLRAYGEGAAVVAASDIAGTPQTGVTDVLTYAVVGTVLYEPVLLALRRLAHEDASSRRSAAAADPGSPSGRQTSPAT